MGERVIEGGMLLVAFLGLAGGFLLMLSKAKYDIIKQIQGIKDELDDDIKDARTEISTTRQWMESELGKIRHELAEPFSALRQKIADVEKEALKELKEYVRRDSFSEAISRVERTMADGIKRLEDFVLRVEKRFEGKGGHE